MNYIRLLNLLFLISACVGKEEKLSRSYTGISDYLEEANLADPSFIYFYAGRPRLPLPNVYCFDKNGIRVSSPPQCFGIIEKYICSLSTSVVAAQSNSPSLAEFLDSVPIVDAYDKTLRANDPGAYDYYLFIDFIALPEPSFQKTLFNASKQAKNSDKKIKLFLVHALSEKNAHLFKKDTTIVNTIRK